MLKVKKEFQNTKFIIADDYILISFSGNEGIKTIFKNDIVYDVVKTLLVTNPFETLYEEIKKYFSIEMRLHKTYAEKRQLIRSFLNEMMNKNISIKSAVESIYFAYRKLNVNKPKEKLIVNILSTLKDPNRVVELNEEISGVLHELVLAFFDKSGFVQNYIKGTPLKIKNGAFYINNILLPKTKILDHIIKCCFLGIDCKTYINFLKRVILNPNKNIHHELFLFLENGSFPIHEDGTFSAYKKINTNMKDFYTGKFNHVVGELLSISRDKCDDDRNVTCSHGLHFAAFNYLQHYESNQDYKIIEVVIDPKDVVSIPCDHDNMKGRCCKYKVAKVLSTESYDPLQVLFFKETSL